MSCLWPGLGTRCEGRGPGWGAGLGPQRGRAPSCDHGRSPSVFFTSPSLRSVIACASVYTLDSIIFLLPRLRGSQLRDRKQEFPRGFSSGERIVGWRRGAGGKVLKV